MQTEPLLLSLVSIAVMELVGALLALGAITALGTLVGDRIVRAVPMNIIRKTAAAIFMAVGLLTLASVI